MFESFRLSYATVILSAGLFMAPGHAIELSASDYESLEPGMGTVAWEGQEHSLFPVTCRVSGRDYVISGRGADVSVAASFREDAETGEHDFSQANRVTLNHGSDRFAVLARGHLDDMGQPIEGWEPMGPVVGDSGGVVGQPLMRGTNADLIRAFPEGLRIQFRMRCP